MTTAARPRLRPRLVAVFAVGMLVTAVAPSAAVPDELREELRRAQTRMAELDTAASTAVEDYDEAVLALQAATDALDATRRRIGALEARAARQQRLANAYVSDLYKRGPTLQLDAAFGAGGPSEAGVRLATVRRLVQQKGVELAELANTRVELDAGRARLQGQHAEAEALAAELEDRKAAVEHLLERQRDEVATLQRRITELERREAEERARAEAEARERAARLQRQREADARAAEREAAARRERVPAPAPAPAPAPVTAPAPVSPPAEEAVPSSPSAGGSQAGRTAADAGVSQVGKPYRWAGSGPDSYDCSGLTSWAWRKAGRSLPHSSRAQYSSTTRISRSQLQPGDLVFFGSPIHHVAMYIGDGKVVEAPYSGKSVRISSTALGRRDIAGYGRP